MPVDCELLYSASPPLFSRNSFVDYNFRSSFSVAPPPPTVSVHSRRLLRSMPITLPLRPCLIIRQDATSPTSDEEIHNLESTSPTKLKKKVVFADDKGYSLTHVKIMTEPSHCPPRWKDGFLEQVTRGATATVAPNKWDLTFAQPASNYLEFRQKLESECVSLENVIIREVDDTITGTVKVKNLSFSKQVIVRTTCDNWKTNTDFTGTYVPSGCEGTSIHDLYDTFSFEFRIPSEAVQSQKIEFCVCFRCDGHDYWDSNGGKNYGLVTTGMKQDSSFEMHRFEDALKASIDSWAEFASWNHLVNDTPYW